MPSARSRLLALAFAAAAGLLSASTAAQDLGRSWLQSHAAPGTALRRSFRRRPRPTSQGLGADDTEESPRRFPVKVSFVVPCYRLAHLLGECVDSILAQSCNDFEVLIMDDCSPDATPEVAASFRDPRVRHVRNETNLGHLANYNKGIELSRGEYVWLISADDRLRSTEVLARFVSVLDEHPDVGFVFCPAVTYDGRAEGGVTVSHGSADLVFRKGEFLERLLHCNCVPAPAALVRRRCYERDGLFPLDLRFAGDWYMWSAFALSDGVAYLAEPMVNYRLHDLNMTKTCMGDPYRIVAEGIAVRWRVRRLIEDVGSRRLLAFSKQFMAYYFGALLAHRALHGAALGLDLAELEDSLGKYTSNSREQSEILALTFAAAGDQHYDAADRATARRYYERALGENPGAIRTWIKYALLRVGPMGARLRDRAANGRQRADAGAPA
jgi:glycosyltransferase involved in cell wall biosynthesis